MASGTLPHTLCTLTAPRLLLSRDTAGQEEYERLRPLSYGATDIFLIVMSVAHKVTLDNASKKWYQEITTQAPNVPIIFIGNKIDLREEEEEDGKNPNMVYPSLVFPNSLSFQPSVNSLGEQGDWESWLQIQWASQAAFTKLSFY